MSYNGHLVVDADCHIREYWDLHRTYREYVDAEYREAYARFSETVRAAQRGPGDVGFGPIYRHPPLRPLGVYERAEPASAGSASRPTPNRTLIANGRELERKPSEILAGGQIFCAIDPTEDLRHPIEDLGEDIWLFSTDYPHPPANWPDDVSLVTSRAELPESAKIKLLGENAKRFLPPLAVQTLTTTN